MHSSFPCWTGKARPTLPHTPGYPGTRAQRSWPLCGKAEPPRAWLLGQHSQTLLSTQHTRQEKTTNLCTDDRVGQPPCVAVCLVFFRFVAVVVGLATQPTLAIDPRHNAADLQRFPDGRALLLRRLRRVRGDQLHGAVANKLHLAIIFVVHGDAWVSEQGGTFVDHVPGH